ncbi:MAG: hypothetical protein JSS98_06470 [Bacteroidetes bacterium]|nr:hypothetical protein [Bacteroidota bacterium]
MVEGKKEINFSTFATYPAYRRYKKFKEIQKKMEAKFPADSLARPK